MQLVLYNTKCNSNVKNKTKTVLHSSTVSLGKDIDLVRPTVIVNKFNDFETCNYAKLGEKYYFASVNVIDNNRLSIDLKSDVLENVDLSKIDCIIEKSSTKYNIFCNNSDNMILNQTRTQCYKFSNTLPSLNCFLTTT